MKKTILLICLLTIIILIVGCQQQTGVGDQNTNTTTDADKGTTGGTDLSWCSTTSEWAVAAKAADPSAELTAEMETQTVNGKDMEMCCMVITTTGISEKVKACVNQQLYGINFAQEKGGTGWVKVSESYPKEGKVCTKVIVTGMDPIENCA